ncbi:MAG: Asp-tRNA(Asn)/Glu-tRNA(Gln) amidotransferase GatCAB subunit A, partial [Candidatus Dormibacteraeota bacterium]|nr:Asp-tRNA(Asn)/Glu-tRNA(Gln) amidotransferase GatCAB subunit A [Candidatus Dormibacteraeota bacterium]
MALVDATLTELHDRLVRRDVSAAELLDAHLQVIEEKNEGVGAFLRLTTDLARAQAAEADRRLGRGEDVGMLTGIPIAVKDVLSVEGVETTAGSRILAGYRPPYDATAIARLRAAGAVFLGMTNCDEFAMGSSNE